MPSKARLIRTLPSGVHVRNYITQYYSNFLAHIATPFCKSVVTDLVFGKVYCLTESFIAQCLPQEMIIIESAVFGRMQVGRCVAKNYGHLGCSVDVMSYLDAACSGLNSCEFSVSDPALVRTRPCPPDLQDLVLVTYKTLSSWHPRDITRPCPRDLQDLVLVT